MVSEDESREDTPKEAGRVQIREGSWALNEVWILFSLPEKTC